MEQTIPYRQIRATYTARTIIVYQAYNHEIATAACAHQRLDASSKFSASQMTWIKPSWAWMLYRSGYSYKDPGQERILALTMNMDAFLDLLRKSVVAEVHTKPTASKEEAVKDVPTRNEPYIRVQWDPERTIRLERLGYRSIQIGVPGALIKDLVGGIVKIEDVTARARQLKQILDENGKASDAELTKLGLIPTEDVLDVDGELQNILHMQSTQ